MKNLFLLFTIPLFVFAKGFQALENRFPDQNIDFLLEESSYIQSSRGVVPLKTYKIEKFSKNLYRLHLFFEAPEKVKKRKIAEGVYIQVVERKAIKVNLVSPFWYRGGRIIAFQTQSGIRLFDLSPKCFLVEEGRKLTPKYNTGDISFNLNGFRVHLFLTFTRCYF